MSRYTRKRAGITFPDLDSLIPVRRLIDEAKLGVQNKKRTIEDSPFRVTLNKVAEENDSSDTVDIEDVTGSGAGGLFPGLLITAPVAAAAMAGMSLLKRRQAKKLETEKKELYDQAMDTMMEVKRADDEETRNPDMNVRHALYLEALLETLRQVTTCLEMDLEVFEKRREF